MSNWKCEGYGCETILTEDTAFKGITSKGREAWLCKSCQAIWNQALEAEQEDARSKGLRGPLDWNVW